MRTLCPSNVMNDDKALTTDAPAEVAEAQTKIPPARANTAVAPAKDTNHRTVLRIDGPWAGHIYGTSTGKEFAEFLQDGAKATGTLRLNDDALGIILYTCTGTVSNEVELECVLHQVPDDVESPIARVVGTVQADGAFRGRWQTDEGAAGLVHLFPHKIERNEANNTKLEPEQIYNRVERLGSSIGAASIDYSVPVARGDQLPSKLC